MKQCVSNTASDSSATYLLNMIGEKSLVYGSKIIQMTTNANGISTLSSSKETLEVVEHFESPIYDSSSSCNKKRVIIFVATQGSNKLTTLTLDIEESRKNEKFSSRGELDISADKNDIRALSCSTEADKLDSKLFNANCFIASLSGTKFKLIKFVLNFDKKGDEIIQLKTIKDKGSIAGLSVQNISSSHNKYFVLIGTKYKSSTRMKNKRFYGILIDKLTGNIIGSFSLSNISLQDKNLLSISTSMGYSINSKKDEEPYIYLINKHFNKVNHNTTDFASITLTRNKIDKIMLTVKNQDLKLDDFSLVLCDFDGNSLVDINLSTLLRMKAKIPGNPVFIGVLVGVLILSLVVVMIGLMGYVAIAKYDAYIA